MSVTTTDPFGGLTGQDADAFAVIQNILKEYGLESLSNNVIDFIQNGYGNDTIQLLIQETPEYKQRFSANEVRRQQGLPVLSPGEYLSLESAYRQVMSAAGLPPGYYDNPSDFTDLISRDLSPTEVQQRVQTASSLINNANPEALAYYRQFYTQGDLIAYALDPTKATTVLERQATAAKAAATADVNGVQIDQSLAEQIAATGASDSALQQGFGAAGALAGGLQHLSDIYGGDYTSADAAKEVFLSDPAATKKRKQLASQQRAQFSGSSGIGQTTLSQQTAGQL